MQIEFNIPESESNICPADFKDVRPEQRIPLERVCEILLERLDIKEKTND
jgi:hypothetical protein